MTSDQIEKTLRIAQEIMGWHHDEEMKSYSDVNVPHITVYSSNEVSARTLAGPAEECSEGFRKRSGYKYVINWQYWNPFDAHWPEVIQVLWADQNKKVNLSWEYDKVTCIISYGMRRLPGEDWKPNAGQGTADTPGAAVCEACIQFLELQKESHAMYSV